jgi:N-acetylglucosaminyl-diphospho-decaprenol L-rhamnosyltransferase
MTSQVDVLIVSYLSGSAATAAAAAVEGPGVAVLVWDNSGELLAQEGSTALGTGKNLYYAAPNQQMYEAGSAPYVLLLNPDVLLPFEGLQELVQVLGDDPELWGVAPRLLWPDGTDQNYLRRLPGALDLAGELAPPFRWRRGWASYRCQDIDLVREQDVEQPAAACLLLRRSAVGPVLFDSGYPLFFNDVDLCRRMGAKGRCRYVPTVVAQHEGAASIAASRKAGARTRRMYDDALLTYAKRNLRCSGWIRLLDVMRRVALSVGRVPGR